MSNVSEIKVGDKVRIGKNKLVWDVVRVTTPEEHTMLHPAGIEVNRPTGQHRSFGFEYLAEHPLTVVR